MSLSNTESSAALYTLHRFHTHKHYLADEAEDVFFVFFAAGVVGDVAAFVGGDLVLIDYPLQRGG